MVGDAMVDEGGDVKGEEVVKSNEPQQSDRHRELPHRCGASSLDIAPPLCERS